MKKIFSSTSLKNKNSENSGKVLREMDEFLKVYDDPSSPDNTADTPSSNEDDNPFAEFGDEKEQTPEEIAIAFVKSKREKDRTANPAMARAEDFFRTAGMLEDDKLYYLDSIPRKFFDEYCKEPLITLLNNNPGKTINTLIPQAMEIMLAESERLLLIDMKGLHTLKDMIQLGHIDRNALLRTVMNADGSTTSYIVTRTGLVLKAPANDAHWKRYMQILDLMRDKDIVRDIFDRFIRERFQPAWLKKQGRKFEGFTDEYITENIREQLIEKLTSQTVIDTVTDRHLLLPVPDMDSIALVRCGLKNKISDKEANTFFGIEGKPYALWLPYLGVLSLLDVYPETAEQDILRLALENAFHFEVKNDGHGNITFAEDFGKVIEHDWGFEARVYAAFKEGELQAASAVRLSGAEQRALITKTMRLFTRAMGTERIEQKSTAEFYAACYELLRSTILDHPDQDIDELWHYVMQPMREKGYALLHTNLYNRHPIKNFVFRCFYYFQEVLRLPSPVLNEDIYWPTLEGKVPFEYKDEPFWVEFKKIHDGLLSNQDLVYWVYREMIMRNVDDHKRALQNRPALGVPQEIQNDYIDDHVRKLMNDMHTDMLPKVGFILSANKDLFSNGFRPIVMHSRRGISNPSGYNGALYGTMLGFLTNLISLMGTNVDSLYVNNLGEEGRHWDKDDKFDHGIYETSDDFEFKIEHDTLWGTYIDPI